jgi:TonB-dependent SusC/RagA subfamily outer membrane receptor
VLDALEDYIQYGIEPPEDLREMYVKRLPEVQKLKEQAAADAAGEFMMNLKQSVQLYNERITWWSKAEPLITLQDIEQKKEVVLLNSNSDQQEKGDQPEESSADISGDAGFNAKRSLSEVVVVGYGTQRRRELTGAVATINASQISGVANISQALKGKVAGVEVVQNSGYAGGRDRIYIRGARTLGANREPLYVVDGVPMDPSIINVLDINLVESITVIKSLQATILYGSRAANGVIVITTKLVSRGTAAYKKTIDRYQEMENEDYITELKEKDKRGMYQRYYEMKDSLSKEPAFYFNAAQVLFDAGDKETALRILSNLAEMDHENHQLLRATGYVFDEWKMYENAINVYKRVLAIKEEEPQSYRDLALAYHRNGNHQQAVDLLHKVLTKNWFQYEDRYDGLKSLILNEMNAIIALHKNILDLSAINPGIIRPLPVDLRIVVDWNKDETDIDLHIIEPGGDECMYRNRNTKTGGRLSEDFTEGYGPEEYQIKAAKKGKYFIRVNYYGDSYQKQQMPSFIKLTIYKNFGRPDQTVTIESILMNKQSGMIEIGECKF